MIKAASSAAVGSIIVRALAAVCLTGALSGQVLAGEADAAKAHVVHVVLVWLKEPGNAEHRRRVIEATRSFADLPGVVEIRVGTALASDRPVVDGSFDVGLTIVFESTAAAAAYERHPRHLRATEEVLKPLVERVRIYDFVDGAN